LFWETHRVEVVCGLAAVYFAGLTGTVIGFRRYLKQQAPPFAATISELRSDRECIRAEN
jgi:uncharacterized membrane protein YqjE